MTSRNTILTALALGLVLSAPMAFAQDQATAPTADDQSAAAPATQDQTASSAPAESAAPPTDASAAPAPDAQDPAAAPQDPATSQPPGSPPGAATADPAAGADDTQKLTWSDLDSDKDGKLSKAEVGSVPALLQVFDSADTDQDGLLTPDEYKAFVAADAAGGQDAGGQDDASAPPTEGEQP